MAEPPLDCESCETHYLGTLFACVTLHQLLSRQLLKYLYLYDANGLNQRYFTP